MSVTLDVPIRYVVFVPQPRGIPISVLGLLYVDHEAG